MTQAVFRNRDFTNTIDNPELKLMVERYSWAAIGGPKKATIIAKGSDVDLWNLLFYLRSPVEIYSALGDRVWWGIVSELDIIARSARALKDPTVKTRIRTGISVESFYNRVAVAYTELNAGDSSVGDRQTTSWADSDESQDEYGVKELLWTRDNATQTFAEQARDRKLDQVKYPLPTTNIYKGRRESQAKITCIGFWNTLAWNYYSAAGTTEVDTATQVKTIIDAEGEFIQGTDKRVTSGINSVEYRDGDATALFEVVQLLEMGTTNDLRMLAHVTSSRRVEIYEEPDGTDLPYTIADDGTWFDGYGMKLRKETCPVGRWARLKDSIPASVSSALIANPSKVFIDENEYNVSADELNYKTRESPDAWEFYMVRDG